MLGGLRPPARRFLLVVKKLRIGKIPHPQKHLDRVERLGQEVPRAARERPVPGLGSDVGGENEDRQVVVRGELIAEVLQHRLKFDTREDNRWSTPTWVSREEA